MTISAFLLASPVFFIVGQGLGATVLPIFFGIVILWGLLELYISVSRPFKGTAPPLALIKISRMLWLLFAIYAWLDYKYELLKIDLGLGAQVTIIICYLLALILRIYAVIHLGPSFSYDVQIPVSQSFKCSGLYRLIRHPSYLGISMLGSLPGLILGSVIGFIGMMITTIVVIILRVNHEERLFENYFGPSFNEYQKGTYKLIPFMY